MAPVQSRPKKEEEGVTPGGGRMMTRSLSRRVMKPSTSGNNLNGSEAGGEGAPVPAPPPPRRGGRNMVRMYEGEEVENEGVSPPGEVDLVGQMAGRLEGLRNEDFLNARDEIRDLIKNRPDKWAFLTSKLPIIMKFTVELLQV